MEIRPQTPKDQATTNPDGTPVAVGIDGVRFERLQRLIDHRGSLIEAINSGHDFWEAPVVHLEYMTIAPGRIKGWGVHHHSGDRYVVADGPLRVVLHDGRLGSPTFERFAQFHFSREAPGRLYIPPGVWHATQNYGDHEATVLVFPERTYDHADPDKHRADPYDGPIAFDWTLRDG